MLHRVYVQHPDECLTFVLVTGNPEEDTEACKTFLYALFMPERCVSALNTHCTLNRESLDGSTMHLYQTSL